MQGVCVRGLDVVPHSVTGGSVTSKWLFPVLQVCPLPGTLLKGLMEELVHKSRAGQRLLRLLLLLLPSYPLVLVILLVTWTGICPLSKLLKISCQILQTTIFLLSLLSLLFILLWFIHSLPYLLWPLVPLSVCCISSLCHKGWKYQSRSQHQSGL